MPQDPEQLEALLAEYVEGTLDAAGIRTVESHLSSNPAARALIEQMRGDRAALGALPRLTVPGDLSEDLRGQLERELLLNDKPISAMRVRRFSPPVAAIAAMLFVGLGLAAVAYVLLGDRPKPFLDVALHEAATDGAATLPTSQQAGSKMLASVGASDKEKVLAAPAPADDAVNRKTAMADVARETDATPLKKAESEAMTPAVTAAAPDVNSSVAGGRAEVAETPSAAAATPLPATPALSVAVAATPAEGPVLRMSVVPQVTPSLEISEVAPPAEVVAALAGKSFDLSRRSVVIVVDQRDALDALATVSHAARVAGTPLEVSDRAAQLALPGTASDMQQQQRSLTNVASNVASNANVLGASPIYSRGDATAEVAVVARGLTKTTAASLQSDLKKMQPAIESSAFDVPAALVEGAAIAQATTMPVSVGNAVQTPKRLTAADAIAAGALSAPKAAVAATSPATMPSTQPAVIVAGERLRITLVDPDAFDLRTQHEVVVDDKGNIAMPSLEGVHAAGQTMDALRAGIADAYRASGLMRRAVVHVDSIDSGTASKDAADATRLLDVYVVVRKAAEIAPATEPSVAQPSTMPTTQP